MKEQSQDSRYLVTFSTGISMAIIQGDITHMNSDAIVNAANRHLRHGGGVAGAISRRGGPAIQQESDAWIRQHGPIDAAHTATTSGGKLPCKHIIHTVGPVWGEGNEDDLLSTAITSALNTAEGLGVSSVSLPAISTGIFGFPVQRAADVFMQTLNDFCAYKQHEHLTRILIVLFDQETFNIFTEAFERFTWEHPKS